MGRPKIIVGECAVKTCASKVFGRINGQIYCAAHHSRVKKLGHPDAERPVGIYGKLDRTTPEYKAWISMRERCTNPNNRKYSIYGGRGISVCERWQQSINFLQDMGPRPEGHSLDRIDGDKGYSPENCRWADIYTQNRNRKFRKCNA